MAKIRTVYSTQDDGAGTLRDALRITASYTSEWINAGELANGDIIDFSDALEIDGVITILLSSQLSLPAIDLTIDGGSTTGSGATLATRVVLDAQSAFRCLLNLATGSKTVNNITFKNGEATGSSTGGGVQNQQTLILNTCVFDSCTTATNHGAGCAAILSANTIFNNCVFNLCTSTNCGGGLYSANTSQNTLTNCIFNSCSARSYGGSLYAVNTSQTTLTNCIFIPPENNTISTITNSGTNTDGSLIINSAVICDRVTLGANSTNVINGTLTADNLIINNGASITFSGVDSVLAVTTTASIGAATFTAAADSTGYFATPTGTNVSSATFTGVKTCTYGAGLQTFSIDSDSADWTATNLSTAILIEKQNGSAWDTISANATGGTYSTAFANGETARAFDGSQFLTATNVIVSVLSDFYQVVSGIIGLNDDQQDWITNSHYTTSYPSSDGTTWNDWQIITYATSVDDMDTNVKPFQALSLLARIYDGFDNDAPLLNDGTNISSVHYTCEKKGKGLYETNWTPVTGHNNVSVDTTSVLSSLQTDDAWDVDNVGYNFIVTPDIRTNPLFTTEGWYRMKVTINLSSGNPITFYKEINVVE